MVGNRAVVPTGRVPTVGCRRVTVVPDDRSRCVFESSPRAHNKSPQLPGDRFLVLTFSGPASLPHIDIVWYDVVW